MLNLLKIQPGETVFLDETIQFFIAGQRRGSPRKARIRADEFKAPETAELVLKAVTKRVKMEFDELYKQIEAEDGHNDADD